MSDFRVCHSILILIDRSHFLFRTLRCVDDTTKQHEGLHFFVFLICFPPNVNATPFGYYSLIVIISPMLLLLMHGMAVTVPCERCSERYDFDGNSIFCIEQKGQDKVLRYLNGPERLQDIPLFFFLYFVLRLLRSLYQQIGPLERECECQIVIWFHSSTQGSNVGCDLIAA